MTDVAACPNCGYSTRGLPSDVCPECGQRLPEVAPPSAPHRQWRIAAAALMIAATIAVAWFTAMVPGYPHWWGPLPLTVLIPYFMTENAILALVPVVGAAALMALPVLLGRTRIPLWTSLPVLGAMVFAWCYFAAGISYGRKYQSDGYVAACGSIQAVVTIILAGLWVADYRRRGFLLVLIWHLLVSVWLASYAFPYYGELP